MPPTAGWEGAAESDFAQSAASAARAVSLSAPGTKLAAADLDALLARAGEIPWDHASAIRARVDFGAAGMLSASDLSAALEDMAATESTGSGVIAVARSESAGSSGAVLGVLGSAQTVSDEQNPWRRTISQLALDGQAPEEAHVPHVDVRTDGVVRGAFYDRHVVYTIGVDGRPAAVRRYSEFAWLRGQLAQRHPLRILPGLPPRRLAAVPLALRPGAVLDASHGSALDERRRGLHIFLVLVAGHPVLGADAAFRAFLDSDADVRTLRLAADGAMPGVDEGLSVSGASVGLPRDAANPGFASPPYESTGHSAADYTLDWTPYRDASRWAGVVADAAEALRCTALRLAAAHGALGSEIACADAAAVRLLANTAEGGGAHTFLAEAARATCDGAAPHHVLADNARLLRVLAAATRSAVGAVRGAKFTGFPGLLAALVEAQGAAERLRLQGPAAYTACAPSASIASLLFVRGDAGGVVSGAEAWEHALRKENARVAAVQDELRRGRAQNAEADSMLKEELVWAVSVLRVLVPATLENLRSSLHAHHTIIANLL